MDCRYPFLIELSKSPASIAQSNTQWVGFKKKKASREIPQSLFYATGRTRTGTVLPAWFWVKCVCQFRHSGTKLTLRYLNIFFLWMQEKNRDKWEKLTYDSNSEIDYRYLACIFLSYCENIINIRRENRFPCAQKQEGLIWSRSAAAAGINRLHVRIFANKSFLRGEYLANWIRTLCNGENMYRKQWKTGKK